MGIRSAIQAQVDRESRRHAAIAGPGRRNGEDDAVHSGPGLALEHPVPGLGQGGFIRSERTPLAGLERTARAISSGCSSTADPVGFRARGSPACLTSVEPFWVE